MSKIWILLLLVGAVQFARAFPALEEEQEDDIIDWSSFEYDLSDEERGKVGDWLKNKWDKMKNSWKKVGVKLKAAFNKGREYLKKKGIKVDVLSCQGSKCRSCLIFTLKKKQFCLEFEFSNTGLKISLTKQKDDQEPKIMLGPFNIKTGNVPQCCKLGSFIGQLCLQGVEGRIKSSNGKPHVNLCAVALLKRFGVGAKICIGLEDGKFKFKFNPKLFAGEEENGTIMEAGNKEDEGKPVDAVPE
uniref:Venom redulysin 5 n=1 Tax=Platymeris rhadamanthus TaxID=1134088 RepID=A0A6B9L3V7_PLARH|nr:venom redulysin 5 [Platymeris rhadamanthus]